VPSPLRVGLAAAHLLLAVGLLASLVVAPGVTLPLLAVAVVLTIVTAVLV